MNAEPHTHTLDVRDHGSWWSINYGDQHTMPEKVWSTKFGLIPEARALKNEIKKLIKRHDRASKKSGNSNAAIQEALSQIQLTTPGKWPSDAN